MNPGKLNKRIKFICKSVKQDSDGYSVSENIVFRQCWARIRGLRGKEFYKAAAIQAEDEKIFNCRYFKGLNKTMQIEYNNKFYDITSINDLFEKHEEYEIHAREIKTNG